MLIKGIEKLVYRLVPTKMQISQFLTILSWGKIICTSILESPYMLVVDLGGGTWINGRPLILGKKNKMKPGDRLTCGPVGMTEYTVSWLPFAYETRDSDVEAIVHSEADDFEGLRSLFPDASESDLFEVENPKGLMPLSADASDEDRRNDNEVENSKGPMSMYADALDDDRMNDNEEINLEGLSFLFADVEEGLSC